MDMKKIFVMILLLPLFSCNDWLDVESEKSVTFLNFFKSEQDLESTLISMFGYEKRVCGHSIMRSFDWTGLPADELSTYEGYQTLSSANFFGTQRQESWGQQYNAIYLANMLEENRFRFEDISEERADYWIAQANFIKAYMYFDLARNWGEVPIAPGTEFVDAIAKSSVDSVLGEAIRCAEKALILPTHGQLTDANGNSVSSKQYASLGTVHTLLANIYAWMGGLYGKQEYWEKAEEHASLVIDQKVGVYDLESMDGLIKNTLGAGRTSVETIFSILISTQDENRYYSSLFETRYPGLALTSYPYSPGKTVRDIEKDQNVFKIEIETVNTIFTDENDLRIKAYWKDLGKVVSRYKYTDWDEEDNPIDSVPVYSKYAFLTKWDNPIYSINPTMADDGAYPLLAMEGDRVIWRLADLILLRAECRTRLKKASAVEDLNRIRKRAGLLPYKGSTDSETLRKEIFYERDRELFGEGQRYFDIVRNGYYRDQYPESNRYLLSSKYADLTDGDVNDGVLYLPVGRGALEDNTVVKQNIYWLWHQQ